MTEANLRDATTRLIQAVHAVLSEPRDSRRYYGLAQAALDRCQEALSAASAVQTMIARQTTDRRASGARQPNDGRSSGVRPAGVADVGPRIAELRAHGHGVREIARILGVNASTVSRRLRAPGTQALKHTDPQPGDR